jgi:membrane protein insertase Oxa1/YidC/SpoIIIJ
MSQTWTKAVRSLNTGILALSRLTFGKAAFAIVLIAFLHHLIFLPFKIRVARQIKQNAKKLKELDPTIQEIKAKYKVEPGQRLSPAETAQQGKEIQQLQKAAGISFRAGCLTAILPAFSEIIIKQAITGIAKDERFEDKGILWFPDLTKPERFYILTASLLGISFLKQKLDLETLRRPDEKSLIFDNRIRGILNLLPLLAFGLSLVTRKQQPSGFVIYSIASESFSLAETYYIRKTV